MNKINKKIAALTIILILIALTEKIKFQAIDFYFPVHWVKILLAISLFFMIKKSDTIKDSVKAMIKRKIFTILEKKKVQKDNLIFIIISISIFLFFALPNLDNFMTVDEPRWINIYENEEIKIETKEQATNHDNIKDSYGRSDSYWKSYLGNDFKSTYNQSNPSAPLNFIHLPGYLLKNFGLKTYLYSSRIAIVIHNIIMILILYFLTAKIFDKKKSLLALVLISTMPMYVGYSRIINHDSLQGLYIINFILLIWIAIKEDSSKYFRYGGIFYGLAVMTQYKSVFLTPLLFCLPVLVQITEKDDKKNYYKIFAGRLFDFFLFAILISIIILPANIFFPVVMWQRLFLYPKIYKITLFTIFASLLFYANSKILIKILTKVRENEKILVRSFLTIIIVFFSFIQINCGNIFNRIIENNLSNYTNSLLGSGIFFFYSLPIYILLIWLFWIVKYFIKPEINKNTILNFIFFSILPIAIYNTAQKKINTEEIFYILNSRYIFVFIYIFIISLVSVIDTQIFKNKKIYNTIIAIILILSIYNLTNIKPYYIFFNNVLFPKGLILSQTTWATDTEELIPFLNKNYPKKIKIYSPRGRMDSFLNDNFEIIPWHQDFWLQNPDLLIAGWEKTHRYAKIFNYYLQNKKPIWKREINGQIFSAVYEFDEKLNYEEIMKNDK